MNHVRARRRDLVLLTGAALVLRALAAWPQAQPGYMDAAYYTLGARQLAAGQGFSEWVLWNYLDDPAGLPHPSHLYWMPLPSVLAGGAMGLLGPDYRAAQLPFVLLAALLPPLAYALSWRLAASRRQALVTGGLALFSGYYVIYWGVPEAFAPYALAGALALLATGYALATDRPGWYLLAGAAAALGHLARADGLLLLAALALLGAASFARRPRRALVAGLGVALLAYLAVMAPWFWRNLNATGQPLPAAGAATLWLRSYDELFSYASLPGPERYLAWGWANIVASKLEALRLNLLSFVGANNLVFLLPFTLVGLGRTWRRPEVLPALVYGLLLYAAMTFAFTFPGPRGGALHSSVALLPALFAVAAHGLDAVVAAAARRRRSWNPAQAQAAFGVGAVLIAALLSAWLYRERVLGPGGLADPAWNRAEAAYSRVGAYLRAQGAQGAVVMVNNPPAFTYLTGQPSVVIPNEPLEVVLAAAARYGVEYVVLDGGRPDTLAGEYAGTQPATGLREVQQFADGERGPVRILAVEPAP